MSGNELWSRPDDGGCLPPTVLWSTQMQRLSNPRRLVAIAFAAASVTATVIAAPVGAQTPGASSSAGSQFRVIVQDLANKTDPKSTRFGVKASELIRVGLSKMSTHT